MRYKGYGWLSWLAVVGALWGQGPGEIVQKWTGERYVTLEEFPDGGMTAGARDVHVFLPSGYGAGQERYRVIYFHDGEGVFGGLDGSRGVFADADYALDALVAEKLVHPAILVAVTNTKRVAGGRSIDLVPRWNAEAPGRIEEYYTFLATRLKPYIDSHFRTRPEAAFTGVSGNSLGGLASFYLGYKHPETFGFTGCTSPSLWQMDSRLVGEVARDRKGKTPTRFWLDTGERDSADIETVTPRMVKVLAEKGWVEGDDLAFAVGWGHLHGRTAQRERMRNMLYFLLWKEKPAERGMALRPLADPAAAGLRLETAGDRAYIWPEVQYAHGFFLHAVTARLRTEDATVATVDAGERGRVRNVGPGRTWVTAEFAGLRAQLPVEGYRAGGYERLAVRRVAQTPVVDGDLSEWGTLPYAITGPAGAARARFATAYDERYLYVAVAVEDARLVVRPDKGFAEQDGVAVWLDARPDPRRAESKAWADGYQETFLLAPVSLAMPTVLLQPSYRVPLPEGLLRVCRRNARGYSAEFAIPAGYLRQMQGGDWREFRLNVQVTDYVSTGEPKVELWWQPAWRTMEATAGSGTFRRE
jgi:predicted alpha/beta superfamily hydrolase